MTKLQFDTRWTGPDTSPSVLVLSEHINATYYISFHYAMEALVDEGHVSFSAMSGQTVSNMLSAGMGRRVSASDAVARLIEEVRPDVVVFSRFALPEGPRLAEEFKKREVPVVYHVDDDLLHLPDDLGSRVLGVHGQESVVAARRALMGIADLFYASTSYLADRLRLQFPGIRVFSGIYAPFLVRPSRRTDSLRDEFVIGYMGSKGHVRDLELVEGPLARILDTYPHVRFELFGTIPVPASLTRFGDRVSSSSVIKDYREFLVELSKKAWDVGVAPLKVDEFNMCKAPTKFVEYSSSGIPTMASDISVYRDVIEDKINGRLVGASDWESVLNQVIARPDEARSWSQSAVDSCVDRFSLEVLKRQLRQVIALSQEARSRSA